MSKHLAALALQELYRLAVSRGNKEAMATYEKAMEDLRRSVDCPMALLVAWANL